MNVKVRNIEVDTATAELLEARAAARGVSVAELVAELAAVVDDAAAADADQISELERRWKSVAAGSATVPHEEVVRWLRTWGTPAFRPWHDR